MLSFTTSTAFLNSEPTRDSRGLFSCCFTKSSAIMGELYLRNKSAMCS